jgi:hypothetical protein
MKRWMIAIATLSLGLGAFLPRAATQEISLEQRIAEAAYRYRSFGRVDDELRWAPWLCRLPNASLARVSRGPEAGHGRKIYFVYAQDREAYLSTVRTDAPSPIGQVIVKESFHPREIGETETTFPTTEQADPRDAFRPATEGDRLYGPGEMAGLYVMTFLGERTPGTDRGWLYGTTTADGRVTSAGRIDSCMGCHRSAPHGGLFGLGADVGE